MVTTDKTGTEVIVADNAAEHRYEIRFAADAPAGDPVGFAAYRDRPLESTVQRVFFHTEVAEEFGGRGLGTVLVREALDAARESGFTIVGVCPLVAAFLRKHAEYGPASDRVTPAVLGWLQTVVDTQPPTAR